VPGSPTSDVTGTSMVIFPTSVHAVASQRRMRLAAAEAEAADPPVAGTRPKDSIPTSASISTSEICGWLWSPAFVHWAA